MVLPEWSLVFDDTDDPDAILKENRLDHRKASKFLWIVKRQADSVEDSVEWRHLFVSKSKSKHIGKRHKVTWQGGEPQLPKFQMPKSTEDAEKQWAIDEKFSLKTKERGLSRDSHRLRCSSFVNSRTGRSMNFFCIVFWTSLNFLSSHFGVTPMESLPNFFEFASKSLWIPSIFGHK